MVCKSCLPKPENLLNLNRSDGKERKQLMKQMASDVNQVKRSSPFRFLVAEIDGSL
jgi:hypothetical protein